MKMQISASQNETKTDTENERGLNLAAVRRTVVQVTKPLL